jgi:hypothetical protein
MLLLKHRRTANASLLHRHLSLVSGQQLGRQRQISAPSRRDCCASRGPASAVLAANRTAPSASVPGEGGSRQELASAAVVQQSSDAEAVTVVIPSRCSSRICYRNPAAQEETKKTPSLLEPAR